MKVLITGANGQVGTALREQLESNSGFEYLALTRADLDISSRNDVNNVLSEYKPDCVVNAAAMTNVDLCETEIDNAYAINSLGVRNLAAASEMIDAYLVHLSTDFVFDGESKVPYREHDETNPLSVYAKSKLGGDIEADRYHNSVVLRVAWVFGDLENDFFNWSLKGISKGEISALVSDQVSTPTYSQDIAEVIRYCLGNRIKGLLNVANQGVTSKYTMAQKACDFLGISSDLSEIDAASLNRPAMRPKYSALDTFSLRNQTGIEMRSWEEAMQEHLKRINI